MVRMYERFERALVLEEKVDERVWYRITSKWKKRENCLTKQILFF